MPLGVLILLACTLALFAVAAVKKPQGIPGALRISGHQLAVLALRLPLAFTTAAFIALLVPSDIVAPVIGPESGLSGIAIAAVLGGILPGGPMLTFPLALVIWRAGSGEAQMVSFLASWSIFSIHRVLSYELPMLGGRFVLLRMASSWMLPLVAGACALALAVLLAG